MRRFANCVRHLLSPRGPERAKRPTRLAVEALEDRCVPAIVFNPVFGQETRGDPNHTSNFTVLNSPQVYLIFWGTDWGTTQGTAQANALRDDARAILESPYLSGLREYGSDGHALFRASWIDSQSEPANGGTITDVQNEIAHAIDDPTSPIFGPPSFGPGSSSSVTTSPIYVVVTDPSHSGSGDRFNVYGSYNGHPINMILVNAGAALNGGLKADTFSRNFSHEMAEVMSDPTDDSRGVEAQRPAGLPGNLIGHSWAIAENEPATAYQDWSPGYYYRLNGQVVQPYWSFQYGAFIVPDGNAQPFYLNALWTMDADGTARFSGTYDLRIGDGLANRNDNIVIDTTAEGGVQVTFNGQTATFDPGQIHSISVTTAEGNNNVAVRSTPYGVNATINGGLNSNNNVTIGKNGSLAGIAGTVNVVNGSGHTALVVDDSADTVGRTAKITNNSVTGLSDGDINYTAAQTATGNGVTSVTVYGGQVANTFDIQSTAAFAPLTLYGGTFSNDTITIGNNGSLADIAGTVNVVPGSWGYTNLVVEGSNDLASHDNVVLTDQSLTGLSQGAINYTTGPFGWTTLNVYGGTGDNNYEVKSLSDNTTVNLVKGKDSDTVVLDGVFSNLNVF
jgi:hypothetical protein